MFILKELCDKAQTNEIEVKYIHPVYGCNPVYIKQEGNVLQGFSNGYYASKQLYLKIFL